MVHLKPSIAKHSILIQLQSPFTPTQGKRKDVDQLSDSSPLESYFLCADGSMLSGMFVSCIVNL